MRSHHTVSSAIVVPGRNTNALNLAHRGVYKELQSVAPGAAWHESFWVKPTGF